MIHRSKERIKKTAEVFTPITLVNQILDELEQKDPSIFTDPSKTFLDNSCGNGNFLIEVLKRKLSKGHKPITALRTIYGIDIMADNIEECHQRLTQVIADHKKVSYEEAYERCRGILNKNIVCGDGLTYEFMD